MCTAVFDLILQVHCTSRVQSLVHVRKLRQKWFTLKVGLHSFPRLTLVCVSYAVDLASLEGLHFCVWFVVCLERCCWAQTVPSTPLYVTFKKIQAWNGNGATRRGIIVWRANPGDRAIPSVVLRPLDYWDCGFMYCRSHGSLSVVSVVCWQGWYVWVWAWNHNNEEALAYSGILHHKK